VSIDTSVVQRAGTLPAHRFRLRELRRRSADSGRNSEVRSSDGNDPTDHAPTSPPVGARPCCVVHERPLGRIPGLGQGQDQRPFNRTAARDRDDESDFESPDKHYSKVDFRLPPDGDAIGTIRSTSDPQARDIKDRLAINKAGCTQ